MSEAKRARAANKTLIVEKQAVKEEVENIFGRALTVMTPQENERARKRARSIPAVPIFLRLRNLTRRQKSVKSGQGLWFSRRLCESHPISHCSTFLYSCCCLRQKLLKFAVCKTSANGAKKRRARCCAADSVDECHFFSMLSQP